MKKITFVCILILSLLFCTGCDSMTFGIGIPISEEYKLAGVYESEPGISEKIEFAKDGSMRIYTKENVVLGDFKAKDGKIKINCGSDFASVKLIYDLDGDDLTLYAEEAENLGITYHRVEKGKKTVKIKANRHIDYLEGMFKGSWNQRLLFTKDGTVWSYSKGNLDNSLQKGSYSINNGHLDCQFSEKDFSVANLSEGKNFEFDDKKLILFSDTLGYTTGEIWKQTTDKTYRTTLEKVKSARKKAKKDKNSVESFNPEDYNVYDAAQYDVYDGYDDYYDPYEEYDDYDEYAEASGISGSTSNTSRRDEDEDTYIDTDDIADLPYNSEDVEMEE